MTSSPVRLAWITAIALSATALASCGGDDVLGPPDGPGCTVGTIAPGDSVKGEVTGSSCATFSDMNYENIWFESWTLHAKANTAYVIRLRHVQNANAVDNWDGDLYAYARNAAGDAEWATGWWGSFGASNGNGGDNEEMYLATATDRTISLRVQVSALADTGAYTLSVESCPYTAYPVAGDSLTGRNLANGCLSLGYAARPMRFAFFNFDADTLHAHHAWGTRTAGNGTLFAHASGPDLDIGCYIDSCTWSSYITGLTVFDLDLSTDIYYPGLTTVMIGVDADSSATITTGHTSTAFAAPRPLPSTGRPFGLRPR